MHIAATARTAAAAHTVVARLTWEVFGYMHCMKYAGTVC